MRTEARDVPAAIPSPLRPQLVPIARKVFWWGELDVLAILESGIRLAQAMAAARAIYGEQYNPIMTLKSLTHFGDGDLQKITAEQRTKLVRAATQQPMDLPEIPRVSDFLAAPRL